MAGCPRSPISSLPDELLSAIFVIAMMSLPYQNQPKFHTITSMVNRHWYSITNSTPALWSVIDFSLGDEQLWLAQIRRSGVVLMDVCYLSKEFVPSVFISLNGQAQSPTQWPAEGRLILQIADRIKSLAITWHGALTEMSRVHFPAPFPQLRVLEWTFPRVILRHRQSTPLPIQAPDLQELCLTGQWDWSPISMDNLTILNVDTEEVSVSMDNVLALLSTVRKLTKLRLAGLSWEPTLLSQYISRGQKTLEFASMDKLELTWIQRHAAILLLSSINAPLLRRLVLLMNEDFRMDRWFSDGGHLGADYASVVNLRNNARDYPRLEELELSTEGLLPRECSHLLSKIPRVQTVILWTADEHDGRSNEIVKYIASPINNLGPQLCRLQTEGFSIRQLIEMATPNGVQGIPFLRMNDYYLTRFTVSEGTHRRTVKEDFEKRDRDLRELELLVGDLGPVYEKTRAEFSSWDELLAWRESALYQAV